ncbi:MULTISPECIES: flavin prenyltransferase UbiX [Halorhodospira]|uniref:flavin prenyltransferase UbiX n=1 Tax=Halorhodospira TaxID=85108 RepID=UPI001EE89219|nr:MULTISPECIES: flavin prenyltransferase UbiX [Halorhodospira]MCG5527560.1 UbiX family flavin prenyltransferase [Halorhodospira halophila]MCG5544387.1 UbiX family flavin prenyltransferase [Halorhodospira sp. 9628]
MSGVSVALTGASGLQYGLRLVQTLAGAGETVHLLVSDAARVVAGLETDTPLPRRSAELHRQLVGALDIDPARLHVYSDQQWTAPLASGSAAPQRMVVCPCTTGTLAAIAGGHSDSLIERAADVVLKERGQLVVVPRETPLSAIHLEHMLSLTRLGVVVLPANPGFYHRPQRVEDLIDFVVARILDHLDVAHDLGPRWGKESD